MVSVDSLIDVVVQGLNANFNACDSHREHVVDMANPRPVRPGLDGDPNVPDLRRFRKDLRFFQRSRVNTIHCVQAPFYEIFLVCSREEWKGTAYKDQFHLVHCVSHCA